MTDLIPSIPANFKPSPAPQAQANPGLTLKTLPPPPTIIALPVGSILNGQIVRNDQQGRPVLQTPKGELTLEGQALLTVGTKLAVKLEKVAGEYMTRVLLINDKPPEHARQALPQQQETAPYKPQQQNIQQQQAAEVLQSKLATGAPTILKSVLIASTLSPVQIKQLQNQFPEFAKSDSAPGPGSQAILQVKLTQPPPSPHQPGQSVPLAPQNEESYSPQQTSVNSPAHEQEPASQISQTHSKPAAYYEEQSNSNSSADYDVPGKLPHTEKTQPQPSPSLHDTPDEPGPATTRPQAQVASQPGIRSETPLQNKSVNLFQGTVIGFEKSGEAIIHTPIGAFKTLDSFPAKPGLELEIEVISLKPAPLQETEAKTQNAEPRFSSWPKLGEFLESVKLTSSQAAANLIASLPNTNGKFAAASLPILSALISGDIRKWAESSAAESLDPKDAKELARHILGDSADIQRSASARLEPGWQSFSFPLMDGDQLSRITFLVKRDRDESQQSSQEAGERFIVETSFSELGNFQLDGFVKKSSAAKSLDLIIRTSQPLNDEIKHSIIEIFRLTSEATGLKGSLTFQGSGKFYVSPSEIQAPASGDIIA